MSLPIGTRDVWKLMKLAVDDPAFLHPHQACHCSQFITKERIRVHLYRVLLFRSMEMGLYDHFVNTSVCIRNNSCLNGLADVDKIL